MDFELNEEQLILKRMVRDFAQNEVAPRVGEFWEEKRYPYDLVAKMGELVLMGLAVPEEYGGAGADTMSYVIALEELNVVDHLLASVLQQTTSLVNFPLVNYGSEEQKQRWLVPVVQGKMLGGFGLTEPGGGSDAFGAMATKATLENGQWVINGSKSFITNAGTDISGFVIAAAITGQRPDGRKEVSNIIVPNGTPGYTIGKRLSKLGAPAGWVGELFFEDCKVPEENLLGKRGDGFRQFMRALDEGHIGAAAECVGMARGCYELALRYANERVAFGKPIFQHQAVQFKLVDMALDIELARLITYKAAYLKDSGKPFSKEASMAKLFASEVAVKNAEAAMRIYGGYSYDTESPISRFFRDAIGSVTGEGTPEIQRIVIARHLLREAGL